MSLLQSLFASKKETEDLNTAFAIGMRLSKQHLWETALPSFLIAVDLAHSYTKAQAMLCLCYAHQVDEESLKIHMRHLQKADSRMVEKIKSLPGADVVLCTQKIQGLDSPEFRKVLIEIRDHHKLPSLLDLMVTPSVYINLITEMVRNDYITGVKLKDTKNPVELPDRCCPKLTPNGEAALDIWETTYSIFADNVIALLEQK